MVAERKKQKKTHAEKENENILQSQQILSLILRQLT